MSLEAIVFYLLFIDSLGAIALVWLGEEWYVHHLRLLSRFFPPAKGWATYYFVLVLWIGWLSHSLGAV
jgi:hypothetical protein